MLGTRIKELRIKADLTQDELAEKLELKQSTIGMIETNKRNPSSDTIIKIADLFNTTVDYLLGRTNTPNSNLNKADSSFSPEIRKIARASEKMTPDKSQQMLKILQNIFPEEFEDS